MFRFSPSFFFALVLAAQPTDGVLAANDHESYAHIMERNLGIEYNSCSPGTDCCTDEVEGCLNMGSLGTAIIQPDTCLGFRACKEAAKTGTMTITGSGSCHGAQACAYAAYALGDAIIGSDSCINMAGVSEQGKACEYLGNSGVATVESNSCVGGQSCQNMGKQATASGIVGGGSCHGYAACGGAGSFGQFTVGTGSCTGTNQSCKHIASSLNNVGIIGNDSCRGSYACYRMGYSLEQNTITIGNNSCNNVMANGELSNDYADGACLSVMQNGVGPAFTGPATLTIGSNSCNCVSCCQCLTAGDVVPDNTCNTLVEGDDNCCTGTDGKTTSTSGIPEGTSAAATGGSSGGGGATGDPHIKTWASVWYDFMGACDLILAKSDMFGSGLGLEVQIRTEIRSDWSFITAAAIKIGLSVLEVHADGKYYLDGVANVDLFSSNLSSHRITWQSQRINKDLSFELFTVHLLNEAKFIIEVKNGLLDVSFHDAKSKDLGDSIGLMGSFSDGILFGRDGETAFVDHDLFGQEWQVRDTETMLFKDIGDGPHYPTQCIMPQAPKSLEDRRRLRGGDKSKSVLDAEEACASWPEKMRKACIYDVLATDDLTMAIRGVL